MSANTFDTIKDWVKEHKLRTVGAFWATALASSFAYNFSKPNMKTSMKIIHARLHAQGLTLAALVGAGLLEYMDSNSHNKNEQKMRIEPSFSEVITASAQD